MLSSTITDLCDLVESIVSNDVGIDKSTVNHGGRRFVRRLVIGSS
jgi:hypothetical protein